ncbi:hypothetical protein [Parasitella parasitica]|uniref:Rho-GAP domain-containing protein n=1 Tax=Parasitella parasitica TaxID=35722 RepID=A0A0B7NJI5_9FUNG|nr:hypothetical protein [Parasitella parasitica]
MYYSLDFAANITHLCIEEIRKRGLQERKIFRRTMPNSGLFIKVFSKQTCTSEDLSAVDIHSVATLMQDALWSSQERIISKKSWRSINYETCTLSRLSAVITSKAEQLLIDILDFLVELMQYKNVNLMDAYKLGDALGKVVLGPADCGPIITEKAGHFLTRMIIEHAKVLKKRREHPVESQQQSALRRIDSGFHHSSRHSFYTEYQPICKSQGTQARAKFYDRVVIKTKWASFDWFENAVGIRAMLEDEYEFAPDPPEKPWISIFTSSDMIKYHKDMNASPILYRILREASKPLSPQAKSSSSDPFATSYLFNKSKIYWAERQIQDAFIEFHPQYTNPNGLHENSGAGGDRSNPLKKLNHSLSHIKLNLKKYRSRQDLLDESMISENTTIAAIEDEQPQMKESNEKSGATNVRNVMKKMIKIGGYHSSKIVV